jgi:8-oxo-dGTP pyrophosphatase MutT (NUDIX family)
LGKAGLLTIQLASSLENLNKSRHIRAVNGLTLFSSGRLGRLWRATGLSRPAALQVAALCYRPAGDGYEFLLITNLSRGRWLLPKGWPKPRKSFAAMAAQEAFEEAGVRGEIGAKSLGRFQYAKSFDKGATLECEAVVYPLQVSEVVESFPESGKRDVAWFSRDEAAERVNNPQLSEMLLNFRPEA